MIRVSSDRARGYAEVPGLYLFKGAVDPHHRACDSPGRLAASEPAPPRDPLAEREAVSRAARGDQDALRVLYAAFGRRVQAVALRVLGDAAEAEDVAQEAFAEIWRRAGEYDADRGSVPAWIFTIARSRAINRKNSLRSAARTAVAASRERGETAVAQDEGRLHRARLAEALAALPDEQRAAIELAYFEGLSQSEIALRTGEPLGTIKTRIRLGMEKLAASLGGRGA